MSSTPECVTKTPEIEARKEEVREKLDTIFSDAERRDNSKVNPELGKTAIDIKMDSTDNEAVVFCKQVLGENEKPTDPVESVKKIGKMLADLREFKTNEV